MKWALRAAATERSEVDGGHLRVHNVREELVWDFKTDPIIATRNLQDPAGGRTDLLGKEVEFHLFSDSHRLPISSSIC